MNVVLPIGSVVKIKDLDFPLMIFGFMQSVPALNDEVADYIGVPYPTGNIDLRYQFGFMMSDITEVLFTGYETDDFKDMKTVLEVMKTVRELAEKEKA